MKRVRGCAAATSSWVRGAAPRSAVFDVMNSSFTRTAGSWLASRVCRGRRVGGAGEGVAGGGGGGGAASRGSRGARTAGRVDSRGPPPTRCASASRNVARPGGREVDERSPAHQRLLSSPPTCGCPACPSTTYDASLAAYSVTPVAHQLTTVPLCSHVRPADWSGRCWFQQPRWTIAGSETIGHPRLPHHRRVPTLCLHLAPRFLTGVQACCLLVCSFSLSVGRRVPLPPHSDAAPRAAAAAVHRRHRGGGEAAGEETEEGREEEEGGRGPPITAAVATDGAAAAAGASGSAAVGRSHTRRSGVHKQRSRR